jgi:hypothetical protein
MTPRQTPRLNARSHWRRWLLRADRKQPRHGRAAEQVMNFRRLMVLPLAQTANELRLSHAPTPLVHRSKFGCRCPSRVILDRAGASCRSSHVRNAPLATVGREKSGLS